MIREFKSAFNLLSARQKRDYFLVVIVRSLSAVAELAGIAVVIPLISVLLDFERSSQYGLIGGFYRLLGSPARQEFLVAIMLTGIFCVIASGLSSMLAIFASQRFLKRISSDLASRAYKGHMTKDIEEFYQNSSSEFIRHVNGVTERIAGGIIGTSIVLISRSFQIALMLLVLIYVNFEVTMLIFTIIGGCYLLIFVSVRKKIISLSEKNFAETRDIQQLLIGSYQGIRSILVDNMIGSFVARFDNLKKGSFKRNANIEIIGALPKNLIETAGISTLILVAYMLGQGTTESYRLISTLGLIGIAAYRVLPSAQQIYHSLNRLTAALYVYNEIEKELKSALLRKCAFHGVVLIKPVKVIRFENVTYKIQKKIIIQKFSEKIELDGVVRISGKSGVGKSTLLELMLGLRKPEGGKIYLDDILLDEVDLRSWWRMISYTPQSGYIFDGTLQENIILREKLDESRLQLVSDICGLNVLTESGGEFLSKKLSEGGRNLSGGQACRVLIARALYKDSQIIVFDEAFSSLDIESAKEIIKQFRMKFSQRCLIMVSHRDAELEEDANTISIPPQLRRPNCG